MKSKVMKRLIWKDARMIASLTVAVFAGVIAFNLLQFMLASATEVRWDDRMWLAIGIWILMPNLVALGAPAMLVGGEEESGALAWLRTLPASWRAITCSKLLVSAMAVLLISFVGTVGFQIQWNSFPDYATDRLRAAGNAPEHFVLHVIGQLFFSFVLLLVSFTTAHLFRSPVSALVAVVPIMIVLTLSFISVTNFLSHHGYDRNPWWEMASTQPWLFVALMLAFLATLFMVQQWSARRRLVAPESDLKERIGERVAGDAFRPPSMSWYGVSLTLQSPSRWAALLWQSLRQMGWVIVLALATILTAGVLVAVQANSIAPIASFVAMLAFFMIGGITFYGDAVRQRCQFLHDRGISPTMVWATRVGPTLLAALLVITVTLLCIVATSRFDGEAFLGVFGVAMGVYALCQLVSMWAPRPILVFFLSPVLIGLAGFALAPLFDYYQRAVGVLIVSLPILLFTSWWMTPRWMSRQTGRRFSGVFVASLAMGVLLPYFLIIGGRWVTLPRQRTALRQMMMTVESRVPPENSEPFAIADPPFVASADQMRSMEIATAVKPDQPSFNQRVRSEIEATRQLGSHVSLFGLLSQARKSRATTIVTSDFETPGMEIEEKWSVPDDKSLSVARSERAETDLLVAKALAKWSRVIREKAIVGDATFSEVRGADVADETLAGLLEFYLLKDDEPTRWSEALELLPDNALSRNARLAGLVTSWKRFHDGGGKTFFQQRPGLPSQTWLAVERLRSDRYVDEVAHLMFQQMTSGENFSTMEKQDLLERYLQESHVMPSLSILGNQGRNRVAFARQFIRDGITERRFAQIGRQLRETQKSGSE